MAYKNLHVQSEAQIKKMSSRLSAVRSLLKSKQLYAYIVPSNDPHYSEYVPITDKRREWVSGFDGSAGTAVVTLDKACLWTDGRYHLQASHQLGSEWTLMKQGLEGVPSIEEWLFNNLPEKSNVGVYSYVYPVGAHRRLRDRLKEKIQVTAEDEDVIDLAWREEGKPAVPNGKLLVLPVKFAGESSESKVKRVREVMKKERAQSLVLSQLDDIAWLFNLRGTDVEYNPVFISYAFITHSDVRLYVDSNKVTEEVKKSLPFVEFCPYDALISDMRDFETLNQAQDSSSSSSSSSSSTSRLFWMDSAKLNLAVYNAVESEEVFDREVPVVIMKAVKNAIEIEGMKNAHIRDGAALVQFLHWLDVTRAKGELGKYNEDTICPVLERFRSQQQHFMGLSFDTISGLGPNGAIIHYRANPNTARTLNDTEVLLLDSGGQYLDGTTDVTRTMHLGQPTEFERMCFTSVLKGQIALGKAVFPKGLAGHALDLLARGPGWSEGRDYGHGTGHGIGAFLNVHEGPHGISSVLRAATPTPLQPGMFTSNEPGYYHDGAFGIRLENVMVVKEITFPPLPPSAPKDEEPSASSPAPPKKQYYGFDTVTLAPIQHKMMHFPALSLEEQAYLDAYHAEVRAKVSPLLSEPAREWLKQRTVTCEEWRAGNNSTRGGGGGGGGEGKVANTYPTVCSIM